MKGTQIKQEIFTTEASLPQTNDALLQFLNDTLVFFSGT